MAAAVALVRARARALPLARRLAAVAAAAVVAAFFVRRARVVVGVPTRSFSFDWPLARPSSASLIETFTFAVGCLRARVSGDLIACGGENAPKTANLSAASAFLPPISSVYKRQIDEPLADSSCVDATDLLLKNLRTPTAAAAASL